MIAGEDDVLIAMAGLPGTGKSTLASRLAAGLGGVVLCKDVIRAAMFAAVDYSREQDDAAVAAMYAKAREIVNAGRTVIIDGRTFSKAYQVRDLLAEAKAMGESPRIIECVCSDSVVRERIEGDRKSGTHPAGNRDFSLYLQVKSQAEPLTVPRLVLDTEMLSLDECETKAIAYLHE